MKYWLFVYLNGVAVEEYNAMGNQGVTVGNFRGKEK